MFYRLKEVRKWVRVWNISSLILYSNMCTSPCQLCGEAHKWNPPSCSPCTTEVFPLFSLRYKHTLMAEYLGHRRSLSGFATKPAQHFTSEVVMLFTSESADFENASTLVKRRIFCLHHYLWFLSRSMALVWLDMWFLKPKFRGAFIVRLCIVSNYFNN